MDNQKTLYKGCHVARGLQKKETTQSDSPTILLESIKIFFAMAAKQRFILRSKDISAIFLYGKYLDIEVILEPPKDVKKEGMMSKLRKPLYCLNDASSNYLLNVNEVFADIGL